MKYFLLLITFFSLKKDSSDILGKWRADVKGVAFTFYFRKDSTYETYANNKAYTSGKYIFNNDTCTITDNGCVNNKGEFLKGVYKITFFAQDSLRFNRVSDSCSGRGEGLHLLKFGKIEKVSK